MAKVAWSLAVVMVLVGCGKKAEERLSPTCGKNVTSVACLDMMKGKIAGHPWNFRFGTAVHPAGSDTWMVALYEKDPGVDACAAILKGTPGNEIFAVQFQINELKVGDLDYTVGSGKGSVWLSKTFYKGTGISSESVGAFGSGKVTEVSESSFTGRLDVRGDDNNGVAGQFMVRLCR